ncbi:MAG: hypothetical protein ABR613_07195 [Actinomycetota bacterium]
MTADTGAGAGGGMPTFPCPKCGHQLPAGTPICGNCGTIQGGGGAPYVPEPLAASGIRPGVVVSVFLIVAVAVGAFFARGAISDAFEAVGDAFEGATTQTTEDGGTGGRNGRGGAGDGGSGSNGGKGIAIAYRHVGQVVRDLRAGGIPCTAARVDGSDDYVETGSCQSNGSHVQINLYFQPASLRLAGEIYEEFAFAWVHDDNWYVSGETSLMARIQKVLGGRLYRP